jgi:hypothetical protein
VPSDALAKFDQRMANISRFAHARTTALTLELGVGTELWTRTADVDPLNYRQDADGNPIGGICLEVFPGAHGVDPETGEFFERPAQYVVYDPYASPGHRIRRLDEGQLDRTAAGVPPTSRIVAVIRELARELGTTKQARGTRKHGAGLLSSTEIDYCRFIGALGLVVAGKVLAPVRVERPKRQEEEVW